MKYYKIIKDQNIIDLLQGVVYVKYQKRNKLLLKCDESDAMGVLSSCQSTAYHVEGMQEFPIEKYITVKMVECDLEEYTSLKSIMQENENVYNIETESYEDSIDTIVIEGEYTSDVDEDGDGILDPLSEEDCLTISFVKSSKINAMCKICSKRIVEGFDITLSNGQSYHFSLKVVDQLKISDLKSRADKGDTMLYYHADGQLCSCFTNEDIQLIYQKMNELIDYHTIYYNSLRNYIMSITDINVISAINYGDDVPEEYQSEIFKLIKNNIE